MVVQSELKSFGVLLTDFVGFVRYGPCGRDSLNASQEGHSLVFPRPPGPIGERHNSTVRHYGIVFVCGPISQRATKRKQPFVFVTVLGDKPKSSVEMAGLLGCGSSKAHSRAQSICSPPTDRVISFAQPKGFPEPPWLRPFPEGFLM